MRRAWVAMHTNYRRKNKFRGKHHNRLGWLGIYSMKAMRQESWRQRRAQERFLLVNGRLEELPLSYKKDIIWNYW